MLGVRTPLGSMSDDGSMSNTWCQLIRYGFFKPYIVVSMVRSLDKEGAAVLFKSPQACDKDACLLQKSKNVFCSTSLGNVKMANMGGTIFVWIFDYFDRSR